MDEIPSLNSSGVIWSLLAVLVYFAVQKIGARVGEDLYAHLKRILITLWNRIRGRSTPEEKAVEPVEPKQTTPPSAPPIPATPSPAPAASPPKPANGNGAAFATPRGRYSGLAFLANGEMARLFRAEMTSLPGGERSAVVLKIATSTANGGALNHEGSTLRLLRREGETYSKHFPRVADQFRTAEGLAVNVLEALEGFNLEQLRERFPGGIDPRHTHWIFRRCLSALGYAHSLGILHGHLTPAHILVRPEDHNVCLVDWCYAIHRPAETGQTFRAMDPVYSPPEAHTNLPPLPASDLWSLARCIIFALGGDPATETIPDQVPERVVRLIRFLLKESAVQRPQDAWEIYHTLDKIREELWGPHQFIEFRVPELNA